jgi:hypothetical protein
MSINERRIYCDGITFVFLSSWGSIYVVEILFRHILEWFLVGLGVIIYIFL